MNPKKHIPPISFVPFKNASPKDAPYALLPMRVRGGYKTAKTQARSFYVQPWLLPIIIGQCRIVETGALTFWSQ